MLHLFVTIWSISVNSFLFRLLLVRKQWLSDNRNLELFIHVNKDVVECYWKVCKKFAPASNLGLNTIHTDIQHPCWRQPCLNLTPTENHSHPPLISYMLHLQHNAINLYNFQQLHFKFLIIYSKFITYHLTNCIICSLQIHKIFKIHILMLLIHTLPQSLTQIKSHCCSPFPHSVSFLLFEIVFHYTSQQSCTWD